MGSEPSRNQQRAFVVLGPGRCGTSTLARGLIALGVPFGDRLKPAARKNPRGFFEDLDLLKINYAAHARLGLRRNGSSVAPLGEAVWQSPALQPLAAAAAALIRRRFGPAPIWGCKVGGMMRILPFWERVFADAGQDVSYVLAIRHPASVAASRARLDPYRAIPEKSDLEFAAQILPYAALMQRRPWVVVDYDRVIADPAAEMRRLAGHLSLPLTAEIKSGLGAYAREFVSAAYRRSGTDGATQPLTWRLYEALQSAARDEADPAALAAALADMATEFEALAPILRLVDTLEERLRRRGPTLRGLLLGAYSHLPTAATFGGPRHVEESHARRS